MITGTRENTLQDLSILAKHRHRNPEIENALDQQFHRCDLHRLIFTYLTGPFSKHKRPKAVLDLLKSEARDIRIQILIAADHWNSALKAVITIGRIPRGIERIENTLDNRERSLRTKIGKDLKKQIDNKRPYQEQLVCPILPIIFKNIQNPTSSRMSSNNLNI